jgi:hypothetical protein
MYVYRERSGESQVSEDWRESWTATGEKKHWKKKHVKRKTVGYVTNSL